MNIPKPYQLRVLQEYAALSENVAKLEAFIAGGNSDQLLLLCAQLDAMQAYKLALQLRIEKF